MELRKTWRREGLAGTWFLQLVKGYPLRNRARIERARNGGWTLYVWISASATGWVRHANFQDLRNAKAVGRILAAQHLDENF